MNNLFLLKLIALILIFTISALFGIGSLKFGSYFENSKLLSLFSMFAAGIFLSVTFLDLLPEAHVKKKKKINSNKNKNSLFFI